MKTPKISKVKHINTKRLKALIDNDFVGVDGLDRYPQKEEILDEYFLRTNRLLQKEIDISTNQFDEYEDFLDSEGVPPIPEGEDL